MVITVILLVLAFPSSLKTAESLNFNITNFNDPESAKNMAYQGDGKANNGSIELNIGGYLFRIGRALYGQPLRLWDSSSGNDESATYGDGFAFYIAPRGYQIPPNGAGGTFALFNVEFDTFNGTIDSPMQHVGIDDNSLESVASAKFDIDKNLGKKCNALITYTASNKTLFVSWSFNGTATPHSNSSLSRRIDLMEILPEWVDVGFSASTGKLTERNLIHSWEFSSTLNSSTASNNNSSDSSGAKHGNRLSSVAVVVVVVCAIVLVATTVNVATWVIIMKKKRRKGDYDNDESGPTSAKFDLDRATIPRRFDYKELVAATKGFADDTRLRRGGSGQVYKGVLSHLGRVVAVKRIFTNFESSERVFINEVRIISRLIHRNLVQFVGWYKVALGVALALRYLHEDAEQSVLHRDIKSANVLLDTDFSTKLGDFGMAKLVDPRLRTQRIGVVGTYGYLAPEYINEGRASKESDIYSFGVVALEIASGRRTYQDGEFHVPLMNWVWQLYMEGKVLDVVDERLNKEFDVDQMTSLIIVGLWCTNPDDKERPKAAHVIKVLQLEESLPVLPLDMHDRSPPSLITNTHARPTYYSSQSLPFTNSLGSVGR
ncbi:hypothetical protein GLYMA_14G100400v4 [Glycine max]|uniref:Protein kinase domain-containing protein n=2 Tax=Glycine subgen. Soja TaxID=1462606 RepID=A0A0R0GBL0_SOYBN|nr:hypothetical protein GLYMA_14G100400v4 [Glycine max]RZB68403.1 L-type lectin-domain containing receptor kinase IX.1 [Glycine soja]